MNNAPDDPVELTQALVRCASITPHEAGALSLLERVLAPAGFECHRLTMTAAGTPDVENLYARLGTGSPNLCFAGHTDVVPPGDEQAWTHPPFAGEISGGQLHGRGAADMKGGVACFVAAVLRYARRHPDRLPGSISVLITGDEEGAAVNGTIRVLEWMGARGETIDACVVGEPSNPSALGEEIKIGRRGSLSGHLVVRGKQGHVAYQELARNPIPPLLGACGALLADRFDEGTEHFAPSNLEITSIDVGNATTNIIPAQARANFNIRYNDRHDAARLEARLRATVERAVRGSGVEHALTFSRSGDSFLTQPGKLTGTMVGAVESVTGRTPRLTTGGGTSDARFIKDHCPVIEFGLVNATIHQVDERVAVADLIALTTIYEHFIERFFGQADRS